MCLCLPATHPADAASAKLRGAHLERAENELLDINHFLFGERETLSLKPFLVIRGDPTHLAGPFLKNSPRLQSCFTEAIASQGPEFASHFTGQSFH